MATPKFRITNIALDENENVTEITAVVRDDAYGILTSVLSPVRTTATAQGGTEMTVILPVADTLKLFRECGDMNGHHPLYAKGSTDIYSSLSMVVYGQVPETRTS